jgi:hypothetical protein
MIRQWASGERGLSELYAELFSLVFGSVFEPSRPAAEDLGEADHALLERLERSEVIDQELVALFEQQSQSLRLLDRRLGASQLLDRTEAHVRQMADLLAFSLPGRLRASLAGTLAAAAALAGWQAVDLGRLNRAWLFYETAKSAARDSEDLSVIAHVTAEQAYALVDLGRIQDALAQTRYARQLAGGRVPRVLRAWLCTAEAEMYATSGDPGLTCRLLGQAAQHLGCGDDTGLPFLALDEVHFARWRGHCLARLGSADALDDLAGALSQMDRAFTRARAGVHCDLALAYSQRGEREAVREHARHAAGLADATASVRQQRRIRALLNAE